MTEHKCDQCHWHGHQVVGCFFGGVPSRSDRCLHPGKFQAKTLPPSFAFEAPKQWHLVHEKPKELPKPKTTKAKKRTAKKPTPQRDGKGKFVRREI